MFSEKERIDWFSFSNESLNSSYSLDRTIRAIEPFSLRFRSNLNLVVQHDSWPGYCLNVRVDRPISEILPLLKTTYEKVIQGFPVDYRIVEDMYDSQYKEENKAFTALQVGTWMVALISSIGILSLSVYMSIKRMKEFGIRKVLGATSRQITLLHVGSFMKIALFANVIALPIAYWLMKEWLAGFAYRTNLDGVIFIIVTAITFLLVIISAGYSSLRAGKMNPVDIIKIQ